MVILKYREVNLSLLARFLKIKAMKPFHDPPAVISTLPHDIDFLPFVLLRHRPAKDLRFLDQMKSAMDFSALWRRLQAVPRLSQMGYLRESHMEDDHSRRSEEVSPIIHPCFGRDSEDRPQIHTSPIPM